MSIEIYVINYNLKLMCSDINFFTSGNIHKPLSYWCGLYLSQEEQDNLPLSDEQILVEIINKYGIGKYHINDNLNNESDQKSKYKFTAISNEEIEKIMNHVRTKIISFLPKYALYQLIISKKESYGAVDSWTDFLCVTKHVDKTFSLSIKVEEIIDSVDDPVILYPFRIPIMDNGEEVDYEWPEEWPDVLLGMKVSNFDGEYLRSETLVENNIDDPLIIDNNTSSDDINSWLIKVGWNIDDLSPIYEFVKNHE